MPETLRASLEGFVGEIAGGVAGAAEKVAEATPGSGALGTLLEQAGSTLPGGGPLEAAFRLVIGCRLDLADAPSLLCFPTDRAAYGRLSRLLTRGKRRAPKGQCHLAYGDVVEQGAGQILLALPLTACAPHGGGDVVAFLRGGALWTVNPDGTDAQAIATGNIVGVAWSPDHHQLVLRYGGKAVPPPSETLSAPDAPSLLGVIGVDGGAVVPISPEANVTVCVAPVVRSASLSIASFSPKLAVVKTAPLGGVNVIALEIRL